MQWINWRSLLGYPLLLAAMCSLSTTQTIAQEMPLNPWFSPAFYQAKPAYLAQISLSIEQEENLFKLLHAQLPAIRELQSERMAAEQAVAAQALIHNYDRDVMQPLIERLAKALVAEHIQRAEIDNRIVSLLTPAQREQVIAWWQQQQGGKPVSEDSDDAETEAKADKE